MKTNLRKQTLGFARITTATLAALVITVAAPAADKKTNILVIFGDDVGIANLICYSDGVMGYETPHIDRLAKEGIRFLHYYGEQSSLAVRPF